MNVKPLAIHYTKMNRTTQFNMAGISPFDLALEFDSIQDQGGIKFGGGNAEDASIIHFNAELH